MKKGSIRRMAFEKQNRKREKEEEEKNWCSKMVKW